jgi:dihydropteroate synthase
MPYQFFYADPHIPRLMGILNVTEDSFSDGGAFLEPDMAFRQAERMLQEGAKLIDIGGESTRPGSQPIPADIEIKRVIPVLKRIAAAFPQAGISIDTRKYEVAKEAIACGATIINDISALRDDPRLTELLAENPHVKVILMHMQGEPATMQEAPVYEDVVAAISAFFAERIAFAALNGIGEERLLLDPGIGFGKTLKHNLTLLANLDKFKVFGLPLVIGASRKSFIGALDGSSAQDRIGGTLAAALVAAMQKADILRVHDVRAHHQFFTTLQALNAEGA